jgi:hypothetical protein
MNNLKGHKINSAIELGSLYNSVEKFKGNSTFDKIKTDFASYFRDGIQENLDNNDNLMYGEFILLTNMYQVQGTENNAYLSKNGNNLITVMNNNKNEASVFQILRTDPRSKIKSYLYGNDNDNYVKIGDNIVLNYICQFKDLSSTSIKSGPKVSILTTNKNCGQKLDVGLLPQTNIEPQLDSQFIIQFPRDNNSQQIPINSEVNFVNNTKNLCINTCNYVNNDNVSLRLSSTENNVDNRQDSSTKWKIERVQNSLNPIFVAYQINTLKYPYNNNIFNDFGLITSNDNSGIDGYLYLWGYKDSINITWMGITNSLVGGKEIQLNFKINKQWWRKDESTDSNTDSWNEKYLGTNNNVPILLPFVPVTIESYNNNKLMNKNEKEINQLNSNINNINSLDNNFTSEINNLDNELRIIDLQLNNNKNRNNRIVREIEDKKNLILTRRRMLELSRNKNIYKQKLIYTYIAVIIALILILIISYYYFNK